MQILIALGALLLSACGASDLDLTPTLTLGPDEIRTQAVGTFSADLTATAFAAPTDTPIPTLTPLATFTPFATSTGGVAFGSTAPAAGGTVGCYAMAFVSDVTVPDNTPMDPGEDFTKTWKVQNSGSCAWDAGFKFTFVSGDAMDGTTYTLPSAVAAGATTDISVAMTAPTASGTVRGDWQMYTASGQAIPGGVYVQVVVGGGAAPAPTNTGAAPAAATATATATATTTTP